MEQILLNQPNEQFKKSSTAMVSSLHHGHLYESYKEYIDVVIKNHSEFANFNEMPYYLLGNGINEIYSIDEGWTSNMCVGINKWYVIHHMFQHTDYQKIIFVDYDSAFLKHEHIDIYDEGINGLSPVYGSPYYDSVCLLLYCMYTGVTYDEIKTRTDSVKYNSGFMIIDRSFFDKVDVDKFVDFSVQLLSQVNSSEKNWLTMNNFDFSSIQDCRATTYTPFDEVWLMHHIISKAALSSIKHISDKYNVNNMNLVDDSTVHVHFCTEKQQFYDFYTQQQHKQVFTSIYRNKSWQQGDSNIPLSGDGSRPQNCTKFVNWLIGYIKDNNINSVVDYGCGDGAMWGTKKLPVDTYIGVECVDQIRDERQRRWPESIFVDSLDSETYADLLLIKDVLIHWKDQEIERFMSSVKHRFKHIVVVEWHDSTINNRNDEIDNCRFCPVNYTNILQDYKIIPGVEPVAKTVAVQVNAVGAT